MPPPDNLDYAYEHEEANLEVSRCSVVALHGPAMACSQSEQMIYGLLQLWLQCCSVLSLYHGTFNILDRQ